MYGLDLNDGDLRQLALEQARDSSSMSTSGTFPLQAVAPGTGSRAGFFVVLPVYQAAKTNSTVEDRRRNLRGYVQGVFQIGVMIQTILTSGTSVGGLDLYFNSTTNDELIYFHSSRQRAVAVEARPRSLVMAGLHHLTEIQVGNARWQVTAAPIPGGVGTPSRNTSWITLAGGLLITAFGVGYIGLSTHHTQHLRAANKRLDVQNGRFDAALSNMSQALLMFDLSERLVIANRRYYEMYKLSPDAVKPGCSLREMLDHQLKAGTFSGDADLHFSSRRNDRDEGITYSE